MKTYILEHAGENHIVSLDWLKTRNMDASEASQHICTDNIMLFDGKRVADIKQEYLKHQESGEALGKKQYLDKVINDKFPGSNWDKMISFAKKQMRDIFYQGERKGWVTPEDHKVLMSLVQSGHTVAAHNVGCQFIKQDDEMAVLALVYAHNYGHVGALYRLSGYLAKKGNFVGAITSVVIAADSGADFAVTAIPHVETLNSLEVLSKSIGHNKLQEIIDNLAKKSPHTSARFLQLMMMFLNGDEKCIELLKRISSNPENSPKKNKTDDSFMKRNQMLKAFCCELKDKISNTSGALLVKDPNELIKIYSEVSSKEQYCFTTYKDFLEFDAIFNT